MVPKDKPTRISLFQPVVIWSETLTALYGVRLNSINIKSVHKSMAFSWLLQGYGKFGWPLFQCMWLDPQFPAKFNEEVINEKLIFCTVPPKAFPHEKRKVEFRCLLCLKYVMNCVHNVFEHFKETREKTSELNVLLCRDYWRNS